MTMRMGATLTPMAADRKAWMMRMIPRPRLANTSALPWTWPGSKRAPCSTDGGDVLPYPSNAVRLFTNALLSGRSPASPDWPQPGLLRWGHDLPRPNSGAER